MGKEKLEMSKELPYFKFYINDWSNGDITLEDYELQGLFVNICCYYWSKDCNVTLENLNKKFRGQNGAVETLIDLNIIKSKSDKIHISFLDEQLISKEVQLITNRKNGALGGRPKKEITQIKPIGLNFDNPNKTQIKPNGLNFDNPNKTNINVKESKVIEKKIIVDIEDRKLKFSLSLEEFIPTYGDAMVKAFFRYWTEHNRSGTKFRAENEPTWSLKGRLQTWSENQKNWGKDGSQKGITSILETNEKIINPFKQKD